MPNNLLSEYFTPAELCAELKNSTRTLDRWVRLGEAPPQTRIGRRILYRKQAVADWIRAREQLGRTRS